MALLKAWLIINRKRTLFSITTLCLLFGLLAGLHSTLSQLEGRFLYTYYETHRLDEDGLRSGHFDGYWGRRDNNTWNPPSYEDWLLFRTELDQIFEWAGLSEYIEGVDFVSYSLLMNASSIMFHDYIKLYALSPTIFEALSSLLADGSLPQQKNEVLFCREAEPLSLSSYLNQSYIVNGYPLGDEETSSFYWDNQTIETTGVIPRQTLSLLVHQNLISMDALRCLPRHGSFFLTREDFLFEFLSNFSYFGYQGVEGDFEIHFDFSSYKATGKTLKQASGRLLARESLYVPLLWYSFRVDLSTFAENFIQHFESAKLTFLGFGLPTFALGGIVMLKTASYGMQHRKEEAQLLYRKGITLTTLRIVMLVELAIRLLISVSLGTLMGLVLGDIISSGGSWPDIGTIPDLWQNYLDSEFILLLLLGSALAIFLGVMDYTLTRDIQKQQYTVAQLTEVPPVWIKHYWDVFGLAGGIGGVLGTIWAKDFFETQLSEIPSGIETFFEFVGYFFFFLIFLSILLIILRALNALIKRIGASVWHRSKGTTTLPFWRLSKGISSYWGSLAALSLLVLVILVAFGTIKNSEYHAHESAYFLTGSDIRLKITGNVSSLQNEIRELSDVSEVTVVTRGLWNTRTSQIHTLVITPDSYCRVGHQFRTKYLGLSNLESHLQSLKRTGHVLVDRAATDLLEWNQNTNYSFTLTSEPLGPTFSLHCEAIFDRFPAFVWEEDRTSNMKGSDVAVLHVVMDESTWARIINQSTSATIVGQELLIKVKHPGRSREVLDKLVKDFAAEGESWDDFIAERHSPTSFILPQVFIVLVLIGLVCTIAIISIDAFTTRNKRADQLEFIDLLGIEEKTERLLALAEFGLEILFCCLFIVVPIYFLSGLSYNLLTLREDVLPFIPIFWWIESIFLSLAIVTLSLLTWGMGYWFFGRGVDYEYRQE